jgi:hypothetical protein
MIKNLPRQFEVPFVWMDGLAVTLLALETPVRPRVGASFCFLVWFFLSDDVSYRSVVSHKLPPLDRWRKYHMKKFEFGWITTSQRLTLLFAISKQCNHSFFIIYFSQLLEIMSAFHNISTHLDVKEISVAFQSGLFNECWRESFGHLSPSTRSAECGSEMGTLLISRMYFFRWRIAVWPWRDRGCQRVSG